MHQIKVELNLDENIPEIRAEHNRLEQVFINLVTNAKEMPLAELGEGAEIVLQSTKVGATLAEQEEDDDSDDEADAA